MKSKAPRKSKYNQRLPIESVLNEIQQHPEYVFIQDIYNGLGISPTAFYRWYPTDSDERQQIDEALDANRIDTKQVIRNRLLESKNTAALIALYRLIGTDEERRLLNQYKMDELEARNQKSEIKLVIE